MNADLVELRTMRRRANVLKDGYEQVEQQNVGKEQVNAKHDDGEPLGEGGQLVVVQHRTLWLQTIRAVDAARLDVKCSICLGRSVLGFRPRYLSIRQLHSTTVSLTVDVCGEIPKYDAVWLIKHSAKNPIQAVVIVYKNALFGHAIRHHPDAQ